MTNSRYNLIQGDVIDVLRGMESESVHCVVTSPPYWGLRDYGISGQIGLEPSLDAYVQKMGEVFRDVRRVLRSDGTCWLNLGDSYASDVKGSGGPSKKQLSNAGSRYRMSQHLIHGLKPKDLCMVPARVALALQADGWWLRSEIIWAKGNPMPESVTDRPTSAHEKIFLLSKSERYWYDAEAVKEKATNGERFHGDYAKAGVVRLTGHKNGRDRENNVILQRNLRNVWTINSEPYPMAHFATFPTAIPKRCILAGCPKDGVVLDPFCGSGTTGAVALQYGRKFVGIELNPEYICLAHQRIAPHAAQELLPL